MMKQRFPWRAPAVAILSIAISRADTVSLKDGGELIGVIVSESADQIVIDCLASSGSKDLKKISAGKIAGIKKDREDENAFLMLGDLSSPQTLTDVAVYDVLLETTIPGYIAKYPYSRNVQKLRDITDRCQQERKRLLAGDRKIEGVWFTADQIKNDPSKFEVSMATLQMKNDPMQAEASRQFDEMKERAQKDDSVGALKAYELIERDYPGSRILPDAVTLAKQQLSILHQKIDTTIDNRNFEFSQIQPVLLRSNTDEAKEMAEAIAKEFADADTAIKIASKDGTKFFPIYKHVSYTYLELLPEQLRINIICTEIYKGLGDRNNDLSPLFKLLLLVKSEKNRISLLPVGGMRQSLAYSKEARREIDAGDLSGAKAHIAQALSSWDKNAEIPLLQKMIASLENERKPKTQQSTPQSQAL